MAFADVKVSLISNPPFAIKRINRRSLEDRGGRTTVAVTDGGRCRSGQSPPPLAGLDLASRGLASAPSATAAAANALKSSASPEAELRHRQHHHLLSRDHKGPPGPYAEGHRKSSASPPAACPNNASHAEVRKLRERYFDDAAAAHGLGSSERGYGIGKKASTLALYFFG